MLQSNSDLTLPYLSAHLPGIGGRLRMAVDDFVVEELPLYDAIGEGQHLYISLTKRGLTTKDLQHRLERLFGLRQGSVGFAGMKDKHAVTTQTFSIDVANQSVDQDQALVARIAGEIDVTVNWARRHNNKLRPGHLLGNRFQIVVNELAVDPQTALTQAQAIGAELQERGVPNFFGPQRFGIDGANVTKGQAILRDQRRERNPWLRKFLISAYQSYLCNHYLAQRLARGAFDQLLAGDVAKKYATGGMFDVVDLATEAPRYLAKEISFTAPLYGAKMWAAKAAAGDLEAAIFESGGVTQEQWQKAKVEGTRRIGRLLLPELGIEAAGDGLRFTFSLPKGAFATTVLREFMKVDATALAEIDGDDE